MNANPISIDVANSATGWPKTHNLAVERPSAKSRANSVASTLDAYYPE